MKFKKGKLKSTVPMLVISGLLFSGNIVVQNNKSQKGNVVLSKQNILLGTKGVKDTTVSNNSKDIDKKSYGLSYDPRKILSFNGESVQNFIPTEGFQN